MHTFRRQTSDIRRAAGRVLICGLLSVICCLSTGCGYTFRGNLPAHLKTLYVQPFINRVDFTSEPTNLNRYKIYRPRMELDITNEVIDRFQIEGNLRPAGPDQADAFLVGELVEFRREPLRFAQTGNPEEYRLSIVANVEFRDLRKQAVVWREQVVGDTTFFERGSLAEAEAAAIGRAIEDLARRIVERTIEDW